MNIAKVALNTKIEFSDAGDDVTLRDVLIAILKQVFIEDEGFSGKRPLGNSGWQSELSNSLVEAGVLDHDGEYRAFILRAIEEL